MAAFVNDTFTDTNGTAITSHTGETGATWTLVTSGGGSAPTVQSNRLQGVDGNGYYCARASGTPPSADYYVEAPMYYAQAGGGFTGGIGEAIGIRVSGPSGGTWGYFFGWNDADQAWYLHTMKGGGTSSLTFDNTNDVTRTVGETKTLRIEARTIGSNVNLKCYVDGTLLIEYDDPASDRITAAGNAGFYCVSFNHSFEYASLVANEFAPLATAFQPDAFQTSVFQQFGGVISGGNPDRTVALTGYAATTAQGALTPGIDLALTGQSSTTAGGTLTPVVDPAMLGRAATTARGAPVPVIDFALLGRAATATGGALTPVIDLALLGRAATTAQGTLTPDQSISVALVGRSATAAQGALTPVIDLALTGRSATTAQGALSTSQDITQALTGQAATTAQGALGRSADNAVTPTGRSATATGGTITPTAGNDITLTGRSAAASSGTTIPVIDKALTGQAATATPGVIPNTALPLGRAATTAAGTLTPGAANTVALTGQAATTAQGALGTQVGGNVSIALTGQAAITAQGTLAPEVALTVQGRAATLAAGIIAAARGASLVGQQAVANAGALSAAISAYLLGLQAQALQGTVTFGQVAADDLLLWVQSYPDEVTALQEMAQSFALTVPDADYVQLDPTTDTAVTESNEEYV